MRVIFRILVALGALFLVQGRALAYVSVDVDLSSQTMRVHSANGESYVWPISSGRGRPCDAARRLSAAAVYAMVHSAKYGNAPMPHSIFFYGQYAIHGTNAVGALGSPASHGCIRLSPANAAVLFAMVQSQGRADPHRRLGRGRAMSRARAAIAASWRWPSRRFTIPGR